VAELGSVRTRIQDSGSLRLPSSRSQNSALKAGCSAKRGLAEIQAKK
jgi:hypothetical protein